jgi:hypothetical protein
MAASTTSRRSPVRAQTSVRERAPSWNAVSTDRSGLPLT